MTDSDFRPAREEIDALLNGPGLAFEVDGQTFYIVAPTGEELDEAEFLARLAYERTMALPEMDDLRSEPSNTPPFFKNKAEELANARSVKIRDRWLVAHLLRDADGAPVLDANDADSIAEFESAKWQRVKDAARPIVWKMLGIIRTVPFGWEQESETG